MSRSPMLHSYIYLRVDKNTKGSPFKGRILSYHLFILNLLIILTSGTFLKYR